MQIFKIISYLLLSKITLSCCEIFYFRTSNLKPWHKHELRAIKLDDALDSGDAASMIDAMEEFRSKKTYRPMLTQNTFEFLMTSDEKDRVIEMYNLPTVEPDPDFPEQPATVVLNKRPELSSPIEILAKVAKIAILEVKEMLLGGRRLKMEKSKQVFNYLAKAKAAESAERLLKKETRNLQKARIGRSLFMRFDSENNNIESISKI